MAKDDPALKLLGLALFWPLAVPLLIANALPTKIVEAQTSSAIEALRRHKADEG